MSFPVTLINLVFDPKLLAWDATIPDPPINFFESSLFKTRHGSSFELPSKSHETYSSTIISPITKVFKLFIFDKSSRIFSFLIPCLVKKFFGVLI